VRRGLAYRLVLPLLISCLLVLSGFPTRFTGSSTPERAILPSTGATMTVGPYTVVLGNYNSSSLLQAIREWWVDDYPDLEDNPELHAFLEEYDAHWITDGDEYNETDEWIQVVYVVAMNRTVFRQFTAFFETIIDEEYQFRYLLEKTTIRSDEGLPVNATGILTRALDYVYSHCDFQPPKYYLGAIYRTWQNGTWMWGVGITPYAPEGYQCVYEPPGGISLIPEGVISRYILQGIGMFFNATGHLKEVFYSYPPVGGGGGETGLILGLGVVAAAALIVAVVVLLLRRGKRGETAGEAGKGSLEKQE